MTALAALCVWQVAVWFIPVAMVVAATFVAERWVR